MVYDIHRPDVNGVRPKMEPLISLFDNPDEARIPFFKVWTNDNLVSSIWIQGSLDHAESWGNKIYENSRYFRFFVSAEKGKRYYSEGEQITIELHSAAYRLTKIEGFKKFRKYTGTPQQCANKLKKWLITAAELVNS